MKKTVLAILAVLASPVLAAEDVCFQQPDGTCARQTVKAASTAAAATDTAGVVAISPNGGNPCSNPTAALVSITAATSGTTAVEIVPLSGSQKVYVCSMSVKGVSGTGSPTFSLVQGTGTNCATGQTVLVQSWVVGTSLWTFANPVAVGVAGNAVCYLQTGTTPVANYQIAYVRQ